MRIVNIRAVGLRGATPQGGWANELRPNDAAHTLVLVNTEDGVTGVGSSFTHPDLVRAAVSVLEPLWCGEDALDAERVTEKLHQHSFWFGRGGSVTHAISGINLALWDVLGKVTGQPVGRLLGGRYRNRVRPYASLLMTEPDELHEHLIALRERNFQAFKIGWGQFGRRDTAWDARVVSRARTAVGEHALLAVDAGGSDGFWGRDLKWAARTADMLAEHDVAWFEEPLAPDALDDYVRLCSSSPVPISGGEVLTRRQAFQPFLDGRAFDIVQPDTTKVGGLSEARRIGWAAESRGIRLIPHGWNTAVGLAADLHLASALAHTDLVEYKTGSPYVDELLTTGWTLDSDGMLPVPEAPGLGVELNPAALDRFGDIAA